MDLHVYENGFLRTIELDPKPTVLISEKFEDARNLSSILEAEGYATHVVQGDWPRDYFVCHNGVFLGRSETGYSEGGKFVLADTLGFTSFDLSVKDRLIFEELFGCPIYPMKAYAADHIDLTTFLYPPYAFVDERQYKSDPLPIQKLERAGNVAVVVIDFGSEAQYWPLNCPVFGDKDKFVVANERTPRLLKRFDDLHIPYRTVDAHVSPLTQGGSIRCRTNFIPHPDLLERLSNVGKIVQEIPFKFY